MKIIAGLGNPGENYKNTRHNAGFLALDSLAEHYHFDAFKKADKHKALATEGFIGVEKVLLVKPQTFMNLSGHAVQSLLHFYKLSAADVVVIYDDVDIDSGLLRVRPSGSAAGHNGIKSLIQQLGTSNFVRIRLGVKPLHPFKGDLSDYVLGQLSEEERVLLGQNTERLPALLEMLFTKDIDSVMHQFN